MKMRGSVLVPAMIAGVTICSATWNRVKPATTSNDPVLRQTPAASDTAELQITGVQVLFLGHPADGLIAGSKAKQYRLSISGVGFDPSCKVLENGKKARVLFVDSMHLTARVKRKLLTVTGDFLLQTRNPNGQLSNPVIVDVISQPSTLSIISLSPNVGQAGASVMVTGTGFTPNGNYVRFVHSPTGNTEGAMADAPSADGKTLTFTVTTALCPQCFFNKPPCLVACIAIDPGEYRVSITNANGLSNSLGFLLSSPTGPIGVWGSNPPDAAVRATVTDTNIIVDGLCFTGQVSQTLTTDASGNFSLSGTFFQQIGPVGGPPHPAQYSGSISEGVMTLTISTEGTTFGPYYLVFGNNIVVPKPCV